jgi:creatinine amidohydrolase/Fe(II)-dependent formamide hydrolase-like protein
MLIRRFFIAGLLICFIPATAMSQVLRLGELSVRDLDSIDRAKTVVIMPGGILEEHGPYLPSFNDGYLNSWMADRTAEAIIANRGGTVLMFPAIPLGVGVPGDFAGLTPLSGSYTVRPETLRAVYMDVASALGDDGFRTIFVISRHGVPHHNSALLEAAEYFNDTYDGVMVILTSLVYEGTAEKPEVFTADEQTEHGLIVHAGAEETSQALFLTPQLVANDYVDARPFAAAESSDLTEIAKSPDWLGYFGSPRLASPTDGAALVHHKTAQIIELALQILDGFDWTTLSTRADRALNDPAFIELRNNTEARAARGRQSQEEWLLSRDREQ